MKKPNSTNRLHKAIIAALVLGSMVLGVLAGLYSMGRQVRVASINLIGGGIGGGGSTTTVREAIESGKAKGSVTEPGKATGKKKSDKSGRCIGDECVDVVKTGLMGMTGNLATQQYPDGIERPAGVDNPSITSLDKADKNSTDNAIGVEVSVKDNIALGAKTLLNVGLGSGGSSQTLQQLVESGNPQVSYSDNSGSKTTVSGKANVDEKATADAAAKGELAIQNPDLLVPRKDGTWTTNENIQHDKNNPPKVTDLANAARNSVGNTPTTTTQVEQPPVCRAGNVTVAVGTWVATGANMGDDKLNERQCTQIIAGCGHSGSRACSEVFAADPTMVVLPNNPGTEYVVGMAPYEVSVKEVPKVYKNCINDGETVPTGNARPEVGVCYDGVWKTQEEYQALVMDEYEQNKQEESANADNQDNIQSLPNQDPFSGAKLTADANNSETTPNYPSTITDFYQEHPGRTVISYGGGALAGCTLGLIGGLPGCIAGGIIGSIVGGETGNFLSNADDVMNP